VRNAYVDDVWEATNTIVLMVEFDSFGLENLFKLAHGGIIIRCIVQYYVTNLLTLSVKAK
jgi:hypothetical protein